MLTISLVTLYQTKTYLQEITTLLLMISLQYLFFMTLVRTCKQFLKVFMQCMSVREMGLKH